LAGLFTDLDPLGSGKSKPYLDKKDFFSAEKMATSPKLTGRKASNAGLNATLPSPSATGATPFSGTSNAAAPGSTNSPVPSLDALTNSVGSDQGLRMFSSHNSTITTGPLTHTSTHDTHNQIIASHKTRQRTPSTVSNSSASYNTYEQTRLSNPTPPPRSSVSNSNNPTPFPASNTNEGGYNLTHHHMPQSNFPHFQGLSHIRGPVEGFGFSSHLLGHPEEEKTTIVVDNNSCNNVANSNSRSNHNSNNYSNKTLNTSSVPSSTSHCVVTTIQQNNTEYRPSDKRAGTHRRVQNHTQPLYHPQLKKSAGSVENQCGIKTSEHNNASIWYGGSPEYSASPPLSNVATTIPSYMFPCPSSNHQLIQQQQTNQAYLSQGSSNPPSTSSGLSSGYLVSGENACLKVSLPPESHSSNQSGVDIIPRIGIDDSIGDSNYTESSYGSIPQLEASPRRYRTHGEDEFQYDVSATSLGVPIFLNKTLEKDTKSSIKRTDSPPKLPERTSKSGMHSSISPPPLPPKKQINNLAPMVPSLVTEIKEDNKNFESNVNAEVADEIPVEDDIYDFPPDPTISGTGILNQKNDKTCVTEILKGKSNIKFKGVKKQTKEEGFSHNFLPMITVEELSKMSVMELNEKMMSGHLPSHLKGMSIFELVEYIAKQMTCTTAKENPEESEKTCNTLLSSGYEGARQANGIKPSFSDNFVSNQTENKIKDSKDIYNDPPTRRYNIPSPINNKFRNTESIHSMSPGPPTNARMDISDEEGGDPHTFNFPPTTQNIEEVEKESSSPNNKIDNKETVQNKNDDNDTPENGTLTPKDTSLDQNSSRYEKEQIIMIEDKYAAFRDLELDDVQGWSTQNNRQSIFQTKSNIDDDSLSQGNNDDNVFNEAEFVSQETENREVKQHSNLELKMDNRGSVTVKVEESKEKHPVCSSEGSPCSRSEESGSLQNKSVSDEHPSDIFPTVESNTCHLRELRNESGAHDIKRDSQVPICSVSDDQNDQQEEDSVDHQRDYMKENVVHDKFKVVMDETIPETNSKRDTITKEALKDKFFSSKMEEPVSTRQWTTFDESEPWNTGSGIGRRNSLHASDDCNNAFNNMSDSHHEVAQETNKMYNNSSHLASRGGYSATLGRQHMGNRRQTPLINSRRNIAEGAPSNEHQQIVDAYRDRYATYMREAAKQNYYQENNDPTINKMHLYLESRGIIPVEQNQSPCQLNSSHRRYNLSTGRSEYITDPGSSTTPRQSSCRWPTPSYQYTNDTSMDENRSPMNNIRMSNVVDERNELRRTPNPFNDNFSPNMIQQSIHAAGANTIGLPHQQIPPTLHSSSALHLEEAYLQQFSPVYLEQHQAVHHSQMLQDSDAFQCCENYSESPKSSSNFQAYRYVEGAAYEPSVNHDSSTLEGSDAPQIRKEHEVPQENNSLYHQQHASISSQHSTGSISNHNNEIHFSPGSVQEMKENIRHSSLGSSSSHETAFPKNDEVFQIDQSSLEHPTFKVHAKVIPGVNRSESTKLDSNNESEKFDDDTEDELSVPKSDSINIFSIQSDPFDDEFFKF
jgi:hypothetical protein